MPSPTSGTQAQTVAQFRALIWHSLDNGLLETALFTAERLVAFDIKNGDAVHLHALCLFRNGQYRQAEALTKRWIRHVGCAYIFAQCCLALGNKKEAAGIAALEECKRLWVPVTGWNNHTDTERKILPDAAAMHCMIGKLWAALGDTKKAVESYVAAVKVNPFLWEAFTGLCNTGVNLRVNNIFKPSPDMIEYCKVQPPMYVAEKPVLPTQLASENYQSDPFMSAQIRDRSDLAFNNHPSFFNRLNEGSTSHHLETPTAQTTGVGQGDMLGAANGMGDKTPPIRKTRAAAADLATRKLTSRSSRDPANELKRPVAVAPTTAEPSVPPAPARRSTRLNTLKFGSKLGASDRETRLASKERERDQKKRAASARLRSNLIGGMAGIGKDKEKDRVPEDVNVRGYPTSRHRSTSDNPSQNKRKEPPETSLTRDTKKQMPDVAKIQAPPAPSKPQYDKSREEALTFLLEMYKKMGNGYFGLTRYNCQDALQAFSSLPVAQRETPRIQCLIGKAYHEMAQYKEAEKLFANVRALDPARTEDMEVYSTILWHQRNDTQLSYLAQELMGIDRNAPESWCALGNCFSLQRDHDQALKCFKKATSLDPKLAYAFTLQGHEHVSNEEYDKALTAYRNAVSADNRHYNAWYGLGKVYEKMGKYEVAEKHFRTAAKINPTNNVLVCCVGVVLEKMKDYDAALVQYNNAVKLSPKSSLARFKKAKILMLLQKYDLALHELLILKDLSPNEATVHFSLGRLYKCIHDKPNAIKHLTIALNLDPKAGHLIKEVIENLDEDDSYSVEDSDVYRLLDGDQ